MPEVIGFFKNKSKVVDRVIETYLREHKCLCAWPEFEYWAGKNLTPGMNSTYPIQHELIKAVCTLLIYRSDENIEHSRFYAYGFQVSCEVCERKWIKAKEEFRMLAEKDRMLPLKDTPGLYEKFKHIDFKKCGYNKEKGELVSLEQWAEFMLCELYRE